MSAPSGPEPGHEPEDHAEEHAAGVDGHHDDDHSADAHGDDHGDHHGEGHGHCAHPEYVVANLFNTKGIFGEKGFHGSFESVLPPFWRCDPEHGGGPAGEIRMTMAFNTALVVALLGVVLVKAGKGLARVPSRAQAAAELWVEGLTGLFSGFGGEYVAKKYIGLLGGFFTLILALNLWGMIPGFHSPTADFNTTVAFASIAVVASLVIGMRESGLAAMAYHWCGEPKDLVGWIIGVLLIFPLEVIAQFSRTLSLSFRLFGNIFGGDMVIAVFTVLSADIAAKVAIGNISLLPLPLQLPVMLLHLIASFVQAVVFTALLSVYIAGFCTHHHHEADEH